MKKINLFPMLHQSKSIVLFLFIALNTGVFAQYWNFYFHDWELGTLSNNLKNSSYTFNTSSNTTTAGIMPMYGRGDIVFANNLSVAYSGGTTATTLTLTSTEDIWFNGNISATGGALSLVFNAPAGKRIFINGDISTNGGSITVNNGTPVYFQKTSGTQTINTAGGAMSFGSSALKVLNTGGSLVLNSGSGALTLGANGTIAQESNFYNSPTRLLDWGGPHGSGSSGGAVGGVKSYNVNVVSGRSYTARLYYWDSWDWEYGQLFIVNPSTNTATYYFEAKRLTNPGGSIYDVLYINSYGSYGLVGPAHLGGLAPGQDSWNIDGYANIAFTAQHSGSLRTWTNCNSDLYDESLELYNVWETSGTTIGYNGAARSIEIITTNTTQDACHIAGVISGNLSLKKSGSGTVKLSNYNIFTGGTTVDAGILQLYDPGVSGYGGKGVIINTLTINQNGKVQLTASSTGYASLGWWNGVNNDYRVRTLNINGGILESLGGQQHIWFMDGGVNFNGGGTILTNGGVSEATAASNIEWSLTDINVTNATAPAVISGRIRLRNDLGTYKFTCNVADGSTDNDLLISAAITQAASIELVKTGTGKLTLSGANSYAGATTISGGTLAIQNNAPNPTNKTFNGTGQLIIEPAGTSFTNTFSTTDWTFSSSLTGLTLGKSGNLADITNTLNQTINGPITVYGKTVTVSNNLISSAANQAVTLRATGNVDVAASKTIQTNGGNIILWADSDASGAGGIRIDDNVILDSRTAADRSATTNTSGGGKIILAGGLDNGGSTSGTSSLTTGLTSGDGIPDGYAVNSGCVAAETGIVLGTSTSNGGHNSQISLLSGSGEIRLHGSSTTTTAGAMGLIFFEGYNLNSGTNGNITLLGNSNIGGGTSIGMDLAAWRNSSSNYTCNSTLQTVNGNINIIGRANGGSSNYGICIDGNLNRHTYTASGTGTITIDGLATGTSPNDMRVTNVDLLAASGAINVIAKGTSGIGIATWNIGNGLFLGQKAGSLVTSSTSNVTVTTNALNTTNQALTVNTAGQLKFEPFGTSFNAPVTWPVTNFSVTNLTGLTLGKANNAVNITIGAATSVNGPITLHGADLTLTGGLTTTNTSTGNITFNGSKLLGAGAIALATGRSVTANLSGNGEYTGDITGTTISLTKTGAGTLTLNPTNTLTFSTVTVTTGGLSIAASKKLTVTGTLTNNATFTLKDNATFVQATTGTSMTGTGTYVVEKALAGNSSTWNSTTSGRFWYMGVPMYKTPRSGFGNYAATSNRLFSYNEATKAYTDITSDTITLNAGKGYVHRRTTDGTLTFTATNASVNDNKGLCNADYTISGLTRTSGSSVGFNLISNPYMAYLDWHAITKNNVEATYYLRSNNSTSNDISALITYNGSNQQLTHNTSLTLTAAQMQYIAPMQAIWVRVGTTASTGTLAMTRSMLSHQTGNPGLKTSTIFPTLARVNLVDGARFDQMLVFMNQDMSNSVDEYDSEKMFVSGAPQLYTMAAGKKLVMNGLNSNKKKISVPVYLELPESKVYNLQLAEYNLEDGLILLEDKQEGTIQDFTIHDTYAFYANSGVLQNRFVLHFYMPDATITAQGPSNNWVAEEGSYTEGGNIMISSDPKGKVAVNLELPADQKAEGMVQVTDANGRVVYSGALEGLTTEFQLNVPSGIYYLTVQSGNIIENKKVFIQD